MSLKTCIKPLAIIISLSPVSFVFADVVDNDKEDQNEQAINEMEKIVITGRKVENYMAVDALTGTKTNTFLRDLPLTVSVLSNELINDRAISRLSEALDNVAGAQRKQGYGGVENFGAFLRGFDSSFLTLRNGMRDFGFYTVRDTANVERFEVLKGPGSVLYGAVYPGGITNTITKKPVSDPLATINLSVGSYDRYKGEADFGGALASSVFYRLNVAYEDNGSFRDQVNNDGWFVAPVVTWVISDNTNLTVEVEHKHSEYTWDIGLPRDEVAFEVPISRFLGEPDGINEVDSSNISTRLEHWLNDDWKFQQQLSYAKTDGDYNLRSFWGVSEDKLSVNRVAYDTQEDSETLVAQHEIVGNISAFGGSHTIVLGTEYYETEQSYDFFFAGLDPLDLFNPVYGAQPQDGGFQLFAEQSNNQGTGFYAQAMSSFDKWKFLFGLRHDRVKNDSTNLMSGVKSAREPDSENSPQLGVVYQPNDKISLYASYGESFLSIISGVTADGEDLKPETGEQIEFGIKQLWMDARLSTNIAVFDIKRQNVSTADPLMPNFRIQTGEQSSRGVELEVSGTPMTGWSIAFSAAFIDAVVTKDNVFEIGSKLPGAPEYSASLWNKYVIQSGMLSGLELGGGIYYVDERAVGLPNGSFNLPSYVRVDAMVAYSLDKWRLQLNLKNLADEEIYDLTSTTIMPQEPRSFSLQLRYAF
ncbi:TonB-dependent siderophore receptor [Aliiglaciecola sp. NS0011-25]|uniref:TonB-dependent siderophore receptor n=1 Tax=Aliiglaciecola sp. NS0011-25 TaxID=3127654 RepID=UPI00310AD1CE